ncbi:MAG: hypothetical protein EXR98_08940 [Gemmataceae bacterium]|nr:hypothetical protein [Gemmataceae bacterium]
MPSITCTNCGAVLKTQAEIPAGKKVKCPKCTQPFVVQAAAAPEPVEKNPFATDDAPAETPKKKGKASDNDGGDEKPKKKSNTLMIVLIVGVLLFCCCSGSCTVVYIAFQDAINKFVGFGDNL